MQTDVFNSQFLLSLPKWNLAQIPKLPSICFAGRSNVGKSSLINAVLGRQNLARTSSTPGRTQELVVFQATIRRQETAIPFLLVDLPGYGYAKVPPEVKKLWRPMVFSYFDNPGALTCCVFLLDIRRTPSGDDLELLEMMTERGVAVLPVVTKSDKVPRTQRAKAFKGIAQALDLDDVRDLRPVSVTEKLGVAELRGELFDVLAEAQGPDDAVT